MTIGKTLPIILTEVTGNDIVSIVNLTIGDDSNGNPREDVTVHEGNPVVAIQRALRQGILYAIRTKPTQSFAIGVANNIKGTDYLFPLTTTEAIREEMIKDAALRMYQHYALLNHKM